MIRSTAKSAFMALAFAGASSASATSFDPVITINVPQNERSIALAAAAVGDLNGDGRTDLVMSVTNNLGFFESDEDYKIHLYEQGSDGVLHLARSLPASWEGQVRYRLEFLTVADLDADGLAEILLLSGSDIVMLGRNSDGSYGERTRFAMPSWVEFSAGITHPGDIDGDGNVDIVLHANGSLFYLLRGDGALGFSQPTYVLSYGEALYGDMAVADLDGDGLQDVVSVLSTGLGAMGVSWGDQSPQRFSEMRAIDFGENFPMATALGDFDNNGLQDIAHSYLELEEISLGTIAYRHTIALREVRRDRTLGPVRAYRTGLDNPGHTSSDANLVAVDIDEDGYTDLASFQNGGLEVHEWKDGTLNSTKLPNPTPNSVFMRGENLIVADLNGDGCRDIAHAQTYHFHVFPAANCMSTPTAHPPTRGSDGRRATPRPTLPRPPKHDGGPSHDR